MEMNQKENMEERDYSTKLNNKQTNRRTLYIVNFTPIRLLVFSVSAASLVLFIFVIGFHLGSSKASYAADVSSDILMRENTQLINDLDTTDTLAMADNFNSQENTMQESSIVDSSIENIEPLNNNNTSSSSSSIIREGVSSEDRYNEYTKNLASELDAINANIKGEQTPNSTYTPPEQMIASVKPIEKKEVTTTVPYTKSSSEDSIYFIQVAVGFDKDNTYSARDTLKAKYPKAFVKEEVGSDGKTMYKLKIGRYETREDAQKVLAEIKKIPVYKDSYIYSDKKVS